MPENLTGWKIKAWAMGHVTRVGEGETEVVTKKNLILRLQAPRFFVQKDEVVLSANVHNYLKNQKETTVSLELDGTCLKAITPLTQKITIKANGEERIDWRVKVLEEGEAIIRMKALTNVESDAMEMRFPVYVHGMEKMESFCGVIRPEANQARLTINIPQERRVDESRLEIRYSPTLAYALIDALPYLAEYPYGCTEQTLNRFLPSVITQNILIKMGISLKEIREKRANLNSQELGNDLERAKQWKRWQRDPVFDEETVRDMVKEGIRKLTNMQCTDGGWGWFSGWGEKSYPHTTALVVHGLQLARENDVALTSGILERGLEWLKNYQREQIQKLKNAPKQKNPWKSHADNLDAFVYMVFVDANINNQEMLDFLYRDRTHLSVYAKAMYGLALNKQLTIDKKELLREKLDMIIKNIEQYLVQDKENQTAYLNEPDSYWWYWYGSDIEANAYYLKLLAQVEPKGEKASQIVKYLLNNRKHSTYWNSTRDTAICVEAMADYLRASGEDKPDLTLEIFLDGKKQKEITVNAQNLFTFDNTFLLTGKDITSGKHKVEFKKKGRGPLYFNAYLSYFTLEDYIRKAGLEIKVNRKYYKLIEANKKIKVAGSRGQAVDQQVEKYERVELPDLSVLKSGDLVEIELEIESKNDYEYLIFEDLKPAGFEPVEVRSGYNGNDLGAYVEFRDERVCFFVRGLARGKHSVSYRMRAEIPGKFSVLPTKGYAMYAPELRANADELKLVVEEE
ncbi:MAG: alpha-2-macroglobulin family protein [bacterium]